MLSRLEMHKQHLEEKRQEAHEERKRKFNPHIQYQKYVQKVIQTPYVMQLYEYARPIYKGYKTLRTTYEKSTEGSKDTKSLSRARNSLALSIQCNIRRYSKLLTLTTKVNITDREEFLKQFRLFKEKVKRKFGVTLAYNAVMETQDRGAWHIHLIAYNLTKKLDLKLLNECWVSNPKDGNVDVKVIDDHRNLYRYLIKYLTKEEVQLNKKAVLASKGLKRPTIMELEQPFLSPTEIGNAHYTTSWLFYHGNLEYDTAHNQFDEKKINQCKFTEYYLNTMPPKNN